MNISENKPENSAEKSSYKMKWFSVISALMMNGCAHVSSEILFPINA